MFLFALLASGCSEDELVKDQSTSSTSKLFTASFEGNESRTYIENGNLLRWTEGDQISLFDGNTLNRQYKFNGETGDNAGTFSVVDKPYGTGNDLSANYAVYPYAKDFKITENGVITATLPAEQSYATNSFGLGANTMVAVTEDTDDTFLKFKNVCGYLKLQLYGDDVTIKTITLTGNNNEKLAGKATITPTYGKNPTIIMDDETTETITLDCGENGVKIGSTAKTATVFWMVVPPTTFEKGFTMTVSDIEGRTFTKSTSNKVVIERNVINPMAALQVQPQIQEDKTPYLTFIADAEQTLTMSKAVATLEYSVDGKEWNALGTTTITFGGNKGKLQLRGKSSIGTSEAVANNNDFYSTISFGNTTAVSCSGDIRTLLDYENYTTTSTINARFYGLFKNCTSLTTAPDLPAEDLANMCYAYMFYNCTSLIEAPELPADMVPHGGYYHMFEKCSNLKIAPKLPAMTVGSVGYNTMFAGCTSLVEAPELPATTLEGENHYACMFMNCTSLKKTPTILPSMIATMNCYANMFDGCVNITTAPELPATTLHDWCYDMMFQGCVNLINVPEELPATKLSVICYRYMFSGCEKLKKSPKLPAKELAERCYMGMFTGCTSLEIAPELPATELTAGCYTHMFAGCTSLEASPILKAPKLISSCYETMFYGCNKLNKIHMYATDISAYSCLTHWVKGVSSTGTFYKASAMKSLGQSEDWYNGIPFGWTVKNYDTNNGGAIVKSVTLSKAGTLSQIIPIEEKNEIISLTISGELNGDDISYLREMAGADIKGSKTGGVLTKLDIKNARIVEGGGYYFTSSLNTHYTEASKIGKYMFYNTNLEEVILPSNTLSIGESSFSSCYNLKNILIPSSVVTIEGNAFGNCSNLTSIEIPYGVTTIDWGTFQNCTGLTSIKLPETVTSISPTAFNGIHSLAFEVAENNNTYSVIDGVLFSKDKKTLIRYCLDKTNSNYTIPNTTISIGENAFYNCYNLLSVTLPPSSVEKIGNSSFENCSKLTSVTLNEGLKEIGSRAFSQCNSLKTITIPNSVTSLTATFYDNKGLTSVTLSSNLTVLGANTFRGCTNITSVTLPESLLEIKEYAFSKTGLSTLTIPKNVSKIDGSAFNNTDITTLYLKSNTPPEQGLYSFNSEFQNNCTLYVPKGSIKAYRSSSTWKWFKTIIEE